MMITPAQQTAAPLQGTNDCGENRQAGAQQVPSTGTLPGDRVSLSEQAKMQSSGKKTETELNEEQKQQVNQLKKRDAEVKAHEQAHMAAGGGVVQGGASYQYARGPDGKQYAVGGEVKIDLSSEKTPEATIRKMQQVRRAALAPAQPSGADRSVAAQASQIEAQARMELHAKGEESLNKSDETSPSEASGSKASPSTPAPVAPGRENGGYPRPPEQAYLPQHQSQHETSTGRRINLSA
jgi:hypothetical protein